MVEQSMTRAPGDRAARQILATPLTGTLPQPVRLRTCSPAGSMLMTSLAAAHRFLAFPAARQPVWMARLRPRAPDQTPASCAPALARLEAMAPPCCQAR